MRVGQGGGLHFNHRLVILPLLVRLWVLIRLLYATAVGRLDGDHVREVFAGVHTGVSHVAAIRVEIVRVCLADAPLVPAVLAFVPGVGVLLNVLWNRSFDRWSFTCVVVLSGAHALRHAALGAHVLHVAKGLSEASQLARTFAVGASGLLGHLAPSRLHLLVLGHHRGADRYFRRLWLHQRRCLHLRIVLWFVAEHSLALEELGLQAMAAVALGRQGVFAVRCQGM